MKILAVDTCCGLYSVAILVDDELVYFYQSQESNQQSAQLLSSIEAALKAAGLKYQDISHLAVSIGPGSFTGIRIGIAAIQGINLIIKKPVISITTLEALAFGLSSKVLATLEAGKGQYYAQIFNDGQASTELLLLSPEQALAYKDCLMIGALGKKELPNAKSIAFLARQKILSGASSLPLEPLYIREPEAKLPGARSSLNQRNIDKY
jgi:tRNA threonylcarbamoyladenosine biosynthesis protein TsaB